MLDLRHVTVIGAGTMGSGIAQWFASQMVQVDLVDTNDVFSESAVKKIHGEWDKLVEKEKLSSCRSEQYKVLIESVSREKINPNTELVIEAVFEDLNIKKELFSYLDKKVSASTILASNTSSFPIAEMSKELSPERKKRFLGLHFFNPAPVMKLVEIINSSSTDPEISKTLYEWFEAKKKKPALCSDSPGFIVNRVARNFYGESLRIAGHFDEKKISKIDEVMREVGGFKMGPFELMDLIGIDINYSVTESVWKAYFHEPRFAPHRLQKEMVESGRIGKKVKQGFYKYDK